MWLAQLKAKVWLIHVSAPDPEFVGYDASPQVVRDQRAAELHHERGILQEIAARLRSQGAEAEARL